MTPDDSCDCSICVPPKTVQSGYALRVLQESPVREVCSVVGGLHGCDGSPHTSLLPVSGDGKGAAMVVQEVRDNLPPVRLEG